MKFVILLAVVACAYGSQKPSQIGFGSFTKVSPKFNSPKVINGEAAKLGEFPYQVSLQLIGGLAGGHYCGGSMISFSTVMTAGHCVTEVNIGVFQHIEAFVGLVELSNPGDNVQSSRISKTIVNPNFPGGVAPNDVALHILATKFVESKYVSMIALPTEDFVPDTTVILTGWGSTSQTQLPHMPNDLQRSDLTLLSNDECNELINEVESGAPFDDSMVCTEGTSDGAGACSGDSGGPLVSNGTQYGIVSWGFIPCGKNPSVFTSVQRHLAFIQENMV